ncbi:MAG: M23 family metallopeptidase [Bernardetiaceae bacterium]|nr:M23 family metallopeptidase [Bernardetiaceae bacterium]
MYYIRILPIFMLLLLIGCTQLPKQKYAQFEVPTSYKYENDEISLGLENLLQCPLRIWIYSSDKDLQDRLNQTNPVELSKQSDTVLVFPNMPNFKGKITLNTHLGSPSKKIDTIKMELPFPKGKTYKVVQGNNSSFTHNTEWSRYAIDFNLKTNDTICAATSGYVVGVIEGYEQGGQGAEWKPFANFITIYEPNSGIFTQYVHLVKNGALVKVGDSIERGQPIALSGNTGQTAGEHLHFNALIPVESKDGKDEGLKSFPIEFVEGYKGWDLKRGDRVKK